MPAPALRKVARYGVRNAWIVYNNAGALAYHRVWVTEKCQVKIAQVKLEIAGDGQKIERNYGYECTGSIESSVEDNFIDTYISALTQVLPGSGDGFESAYVHGSSTDLQQVYSGFMLNLDAEDITGTLAAPVPLVERYYYPRVVFNPLELSDAQSMALHTRMFSWTARRTTTDVTGATLTGFSGLGAFWRREFISNPANFDPDASQLVL